MRTTLNQKLSKEENKGRNLGENPKRNRAGEQRTSVTAFSNTPNPHSLPSTSLVPVLLCEDCHRRETIL